METQSTVYSFVEILVAFATKGLVPFMVVMFFGAIVLRGLIYYTIKREDWFAKEFEKRVDNFVAEQRAEGSVSFYMLTKKILEKTFYDLFELRYYMKRRNPDFIMTVTDRIFLIKQGSAIFVRDILKHVRYLRFNENNHPKLFETSKKTLAKNPAFSKVFGILPASAMNDILNILPGIFIILGVFGTFLGIMNALPELGSMDLNNVETTKMTMDDFLVKISFSMSTSLIGIVLSVIMSFLNAGMSPEKIFVSAVDRLESALDSLWHLSTDNNVPDGVSDFDENRSPEEVLAEQAVQKELHLAEGPNRGGPAKEPKAS